LSLCIVRDNPKAFFVLSYVLAIAPPAAPAAPAPIPIPSPAASPLLMNGVNVDCVSAIGVTSVSVVPSEPNAAADPAPTATAPAANPIISADNVVSLCK